MQLIPAKLLLWLCPFSIVMMKMLVFFIPINALYIGCLAFTMQDIPRGVSSTVYPKKYAHGFCFAVLCCGYTLTDFPISIRLTSLALWQSNDCPSASKATLMNMDKYFMWIHYERLHDHNEAKHNKTVCIFLGIYCRYNDQTPDLQYYVVNMFVSCGQIRHLKQHACANRLCHRR